MLRLSVREITSVSATFILSSNLHSSADPPLSSLGLSPDQESIVPAEPGNATANPNTPSSLIADALSKGLSVTVNGSAWPRTFIRIDEQIDEAVIIIYALMPGRQYDIELGLASCQSNNNITEQEQEQAIMGDFITRTLRKQIITQENEGYNNDPDSSTLENDSSSSSSSSSSLSSPSSSTPLTNSSFITSPPPSTPPPPPPPPLSQPQSASLTLTDRLTQLHQSLTHLTTERDSLLTSLKTHRRESQKAESSLRAEIDTLKRTFDKNASFELRSKQKLLALQESVKRAQNAARESEESKRQVESEILELTKRKEEKENEHVRMEDEAGRMRRQRGQVEEKEKKREECMRGEMNGLTNKLERLNGKRERMEAMVIPDLEAKVQDIEGEIEDAELEVARLEKEEQIRIQLEDTYLSYHHQQSAGPLWGPPTTTTSSTTRPARTHNPRSQSMHTTPVTYPPPHRRSSLKSASMSLQPHHHQHTSPITPSSPADSIINLKGSIKASNSGHSPTDPLAVGAGRPSRRSFEATVRAGRTAE